MVAWLRFLPMTLTRLTNPIVFFVRRRVANSIFFKDKVFLPTTRAGNNFILNVQQAVTRNKTKKREIAAEQRRTLTEAEAINIGADFIAQVSAIIIGCGIIELCDMLSKRQQAKRQNEIDNHIKDLKETVIRLDGKDSEYEQRIRILEAMVHELTVQRKVISTVSAEEKEIPEILTN